MKKNIQRAILLVLIVVAIIIPVRQWTLQAKESNDVDEIGALIARFKETIHPNTKLSFTSSGKEIENIILFDYALLIMAPTVITDNRFQNDTILAINKVQNAGAASYKDYTIVEKKRSQKYIVHLLVKK